MMQSIRSFVKKSLYWIAIKSTRIEIKNLYVGLITFFSMFFFSVAMLFSTAFYYIGVALLSLFIIYFFVVLFIIPISFGSIMSQYFFRKMDIMNILHIIAGVLFLIVILTLPYIGITFFFLLFFYTFGLVSRLAWYSL